MNEESALRPIRAAVRRMSAYVPGEQPDEAGWIKLNQNENPYPPSPAVEAAIRTEIETLGRYGEPSNRIVRNAAAAVYGLDPDWITAVNGSDEILRILCQTCLGEGDRVVMPEPTFPFYKTLAAVQGARIETIPLDDDFALPATLPDLAGAKLVFLPNPNAPSGTLFPEEEIRRLLDAVPEALVVVDEAYADFAGISALPLLARHPRLVVTRTLSKSYALAGLRVGLGFAAPALVREFDKVRDYYNLDRLAQVGAAAALRDTASLATTLARIRATRDRLAEGLRNLGLHVWPSAANFVLARAADPSAETLAAELRARKILVRRFPAPRLRDCLRITVGTDAETDALLAALREILGA